MNTNGNGNSDDDGGDGPKGGFRQRLYQLRRDKGWSQSELARRIWGTAEDARGYTVAKNRDRISAYEAGKAVPERSNLDAIAEALDVNVADLAPDLVLSNPRLAPRTAALSVNFMPGKGQAHLKVDAVVPSSIALEVLRIIEGSTPLPPPEAA